MNKYSLLMSGTEPNLLSEEPAYVEKDRGWEKHSTKYKFNMMDDSLVNSFLYNNNIELSNNKSNCENKDNKFGNYFKQCSINESSALWGSFNPVSDKCNNNRHKGTPCHSLWNNQTRRKGVVLDTRK